MAQSPPPNDNFANAELISGVKGTVQGSNVDATPEAGEPAHADSGPDHSIWYRYTPGRGRVTINTNGSMVNSDVSLDTVLAVYTGTAVDSLTEVTSNDDGPNQQDWSQVSFTSQTGTTYWIAVDGFDGESGTVVLNWGFEGVKLTQDTPTATVGEDHTVTASVTSADGDSVGADEDVTFRVLDGPNAGLTSQALTNSDGEATFTYSSSVPGTDEIEATFVRGEVNSDPLAVSWVTASSAPGTPAKADVGFSVSGPTSARVGQSVTFKVIVTNGGPDTATGIVLRTPVPAGATLGSVSATSGNGCTGGSTPTCYIGTLAPGASATVTLVVTATQVGPLTLSPSVESDSDSNPANNNSSKSVTVISATAPPLPPPPSSAPGTFNAISVGTVTVNGVLVPSDQVFQLNSGDVVDVTNGTLTFTGSDGSYLSVAATQFTARRTSSRSTRAAAGDVPAQFKVTQPATAGVTTLALIGGDFTSCGKSRSLSATDKRPVRRLWGSGKGSFRTQARYSAATVRGTIWLTEDRCDGSLTTVVQGVVDVLDKSLNKTVSVNPGQSYLAVPKKKAPLKPPATKHGGTQSAAAIRQSGLVWAGRRFTSRAQFQKFLAAKGKTWADFKKHYPVQAAALASRK